MQLQSQSTETRTPKEAEVVGILKQMATVLRNMRTYDQNNPVLQRSFDKLFSRMVAFLEHNLSLTLLVRENELIYGTNVVYSSTDKMESLAFAVYRDGIRLISFRDGLCMYPGELYEFMSALHDAREADPYQADLVTILWEKDFANINYRAVDAYLEDDEKKSIEAIASKCDQPPIEGMEGDTHPSTEFFEKELGISAEPKATPAGQVKLVANEDAVRAIMREILEEDDRNILRRCSTICLETLSLAPREDTFNRVVDFLGRICDWLVSSGDFLNACAILSDLHSLAKQDDMPEPRVASIMDIIAKRGEKQKLLQIKAYLEDASDQRTEETFAYLALMAPVAVGPLCELLAECEVRKIRYLLCRAISIVARNEPHRLRFYVQDHRWFFVRNIVMILGMMANHEGLKLLGLAVSHPEARVRREVARSVGKIRGPEGIEILKMLASDDNKMVRLASFASMRQIRSPESRAFLEQLITDKSFNKKSLDEKKEAARTYGELGTDGFNFLMSIINGEHKALGDEACAAAVFGLATIPGDRTLDVLRKLLDQGEGPVRQAASESLATLEQMVDLR